MTSQARRIALGGMLAALATVMMTLGGSLGIATYVVPMLSMMLLRIVMRLCGRRIAWAWYGAVSLLGLLLCPDKEAAAVFAALGYYPIVKPSLDQKKLPWLWKGLFFNVTIVVLYWILLNLLGIRELVAEFETMGKWLTVALILMGNLVFFLLDRVLGRPIGRRGGR